MRLQWNGSLQEEWSDGPDASGREDDMNKRGLLVGALVAAALIVTIGSISGDASAEGRSDADVIMMRCSTTGSSFKTTLYEGSSATPTKRADNCPENISLLLKGGFEIRDAFLSEGEAEYIVYTLVR
jgi:hypothetical protein